MTIFSKVFVEKTAERMGKTFVQFYLGFWMLSMGLLNTTAEVAGPGAFDSLFTIDNAKAGVVGVALSLATSIGTKGFGPDKESPSLV
jgi:hypothetical protein